MRNRWMAVTTALLALAATPVLAQQHQHGQPQQADTARTGMMGGMTGMMQSMTGTMGMMESMLPSPAMLIHAADMLALTPDQRQRIQQLAASAGEEHQRHMQAAMDARRRAAFTLDTEHPDLNAYAAAFREGTEHMALAHIGMTRAALDAHSVLTSAQRDKLKNATALMRAMHGDSMHGGMMGGM